jgi:putative DNA methylase
MTQRRLIEEAFPLKKVSEDSKHQKNVRHGHISTPHFWPTNRLPRSQRLANDPPESPEQVRCTWAIAS